MKHITPTRPDVDEFQKACLGEFLGTMILLLLGNGVVAGVVLNKSKAQNAGWIVITAAWAFAVLAGVLTAKAVGAPGFINPVGPLAMVILGKLEVGRAMALAGAELGGAFLGATLVWLHYLPHWAETSDAEAKRAAFCTSPGIRSPGANVLSEAIATFVLVFAGTAIIEKTLGKDLLVPIGAALV